MSANDKNPDLIGQLPLSERYPRLGPRAISWLYNQKNLDLTDLTDEQIEALVPLDRQKVWTPWRWVALVFVLFSISCMIFHIKGWAGTAGMISLIFSMLPNFLVERSCSRRFHKATNKRLPG